MSKDDPIGFKKVTQAATDIAFNPIRETFRAVGLDGLVKATDDVHDFADGINTKTADWASGKTARDKQKADDANAAVAKKNAGIRSENQKKAKAAAFDASEKDRMSVGSGARTLLTGPAGLEDSSEEDQYSLSRKTLKGN